MGRIALSVLKWLGIGLAALALLDLLGFALLFAVNWGDQPPSPAAQALSFRAANPYADAQNIYLAVQGLTAPAGQSTPLTGAARVARYDATLEARLRDPYRQAAIVTDAGEAPLTFRGDPRVLASGSEPLPTAVLAHQAQLERLLTDNAELYRRYRALPQLAGYYATARPGGYLSTSVEPPELNQMHRLLLADIALRAQDARSAAQARGELCADVRLWQAVLRGDGTLLSASLALSRLHEDQLLLADLVASSAADFSAAHADTLAPVTPLAEWSLAPGIAGEFRERAATNRQLHAFEPAATGAPLADWWARIRNRLSMHFFKEQATENLIAQQTESELASARDPHLQPPPGRDQPLRGLIYNPVGKTLADLGQTQMVYGYVRRAWDEAAMQRLVRLALEIRQQRVVAAAVPAFLAQHPEWSTHPGSGVPFRWDEARGEISIVTLGTYPSYRRYRVHIWQPGAA